jgi:hypothetical protein
MPKRLTYNYVKNYIENEISLGYKLLSTEYKTNAQPLDIECEKGHVFQKSFAEIKCGKTSCKICSPFTLDYNSVKDYIENELGRGYKLISKSYKNNSTKMDIQCPEGHLFQKSYQQFKGDNARCPECYQRNYSYEDVKNFIEIELGYKLISTEFKTKIPLVVQCDKGHEFYPLFDSIKNQGTRCPFCKKCRLTYNMVKERIESEKGYKLISKVYKNNKEKLDIQCSQGHLYSATLDYFTSGCRCPECTESKAEALIRKYLTSQNVSFLQECEFDGLIGSGGGSLRFDFAILQNSNVKLLIEYDGVFHFNNVYDGSKLDLQKHHDKLKNEYCLRHGIPLIRIHYKDFENIESILSLELNSLNLNTSA